MAYGRTGADGVINSWARTYNAGDHSVSGSATIPTGHHYYVLHEVYSPFEGNYQHAQDSVFDLPYHATNIDGATHTDGYVYHLHVFPKNVNNNPLVKRVTDIDGNPNTHGVRVGDTVNYELTYRFDGVTRPSDADANAGLYLSDITEGNNGVRVSDRLSRAFGTANPGAVTLTYVDNTGAPRTINLTAGTQYTVSQSTTAPTRLPGHTGNLFTTAAPADARVNYVTWDFFNNLAGSSLGLPAGSSNIILHMPISATVTGTDDDLAPDPGALQNDAASDDIKGHQNHTEAHTASAGFQFAKVKTDGTTPVPGVVFRLIAHDGAEDHFLATNGQYYANGDTLPTGVSFVEATSNANGLVTFVNVPVFNRDETTGQDTFKPANQLDFDVVEYDAPRDYHRATMPFKHVTWASHAGQAVTAADQDCHFTPDDFDTNLNFGEYAVATRIYNIDHDPSQPNETEHLVTKGIKNWTNEEPGKPIHLPLTGGQGIVLLLVLGAAIMAIVVIDRKRRAAKAARN